MVFSTMHLLCRPERNWAVRMKTMKRHNKAMHCNLRLILRSTILWGPIFFLVGFRCELGDSENCLLECQFGFQSFFSSHNVLITYFVMWIIIWLPLSRLHYFGQKLALSVLYWGIVITSLKTLHDALSSISQICICFKLMRRPDDIRNQDLH